MAASDTEEEWKEALASRKILESDIEESFVRSGGHGGQNVNKTSTCVLLVHRPTGVQVKCMVTRHQRQNRLLARTMLLEKLDRIQKERWQQQRSQAEKIRRQKRGRSKGAKERILEQKRHRSNLKKARRASTD